MFPVLVTVTVLPVWPPEPWPPSATEAAPKPAVNDPATENPPLPPPPPIDCAKKPFELSPTVLMLHVLSPMTWPDVPPELRLPPIPTAAAAPIPSNEPEADTVTAPPPLPPPPPIDWA